MPVVCDDGDEEVLVVEEEVPEAKRADHVEGTSRPRGDTQPMPVTTTLRKGGVSAWVDMVGIDSGNRGLPLGGGLRWGVDRSRSQTGAAGSRHRDVATATSHHLSELNVPGREMHQGANSSSEDSHQ